MSSFNPSIPSQQSTPYSFKPSSPIPAPQFPSSYSIAARSPSPASLIPPALTRESFRTATFRPNIVLPPVNTVPSTSSSYDLSFYRPHAFRLPPNSFSLPERMELSPPILHPNFSPSHIPKNSNTTLGPLGIFLIAIVVSALVLFILAEYLARRGHCPPEIPGEPFRLSSFSSERASIPSNTIVSVPRDFSFLQHYRPNSSTSDSQFRHSILREIDETTRILYQRHAPPEHPFSMDVTPFAFQINSQTTVFVDPVFLPEFFQRATSPQIRAFQAQLVHLNTRQLENTAIIQGIYERVILHINDLSHKAGGQGIGGYVFLEFPDRKFAVGNYPREIKWDDSKKFNDKTLSIECYCEKKKVEKTLESLRQIKWTRRHNCVYTAVEGLKAMGFVYAEKIDLSKFLPILSELRSQMLNFHGFDPLVNAYPRKRVVIRHLPPKVNSEVKEEFLFQKITPTFLA